MRLRASGQREEAQALAGLRSARQGVRPRYGAEVFVCRRPSP